MGRTEFLTCNDYERALVGMAEPSTRAKWRALRSARLSTLKKYLTGTTLSEMGIFRQLPGPCIKLAMPEGSPVSQKVPCSKCGVPILKSTAMRTNGLCMPCKGGYRVSIEERKRYIREERERRLTDPYRKL